LGVFGDTSVRLDPWQPEFGAEAPGLGLQGDEDAAEVKVDVERPPEDWAPIVPTGGWSPQRLLFVDGVRRVDARIVAQRDGKRFLGAFGSWGVGAVVVEDGKATFAGSTLGRTLGLGSGATLPEPIHVGQALTYVPASTPDETPDGPVFAVHEQMRFAEEATATSLAEHADSLVVGDGPLTFEHTTRGAAVGYVKRILQLYLPTSLWPIVAALPAGARTPLFVLGGRFARYAWFLRLAAPRPGDADTSGLVRMEVSAKLGASEAARLADACTVLVPRFQSVRGLHPRAPQNLLPIGALEGLLRRQLGDGEHVARQIQTFVAREST
jgi:uncharacterized protein